MQIHTCELVPPRGLFWHPAPGTTPEPDDVWAHYGFTGTGMWVAPKKGQLGSSADQQAPTHTGEGLRHLPQLLTPRVQSETGTPAEAAEDTGAVTGCCDSCPTAQPALLKQNTWLNTVAVPSGYARRRRCRSSPTPAVTTATGAATAIDTPADHSSWSAGQGRKT